jgi:hypothetical protein
MNQSQALKTVRECRERYLLYFAFTVIKKTNGGYKEDPKYSPITQYDVVSSDSYDELKEQRDILLSLVSEVNSYVLVIIDRLEAKILKESKKSVKIDTLKKVCNKTYELSWDIKHNCYTEANRILPYLHYDINNRLSKLDFFFRGPHEVPEDYKWDTGEYEGWLQFRWGDGKNAITYGEE